MAAVQEQLAVQEKAITDRRSATVLLGQLRRTLREGARAIVKVGKRVTLPEPVMTALQPPRQASGDELAAYVRATLDHVAPYADAFAEKGLAPNVLKNLPATLDRFVAVKNEQTAAQQRFTAAGTTIHETQVKTKKTIDALEAFAVNTPAARPEVLEKLRSARRIGPRKDRTPKPAAEPAAPAAPPAATKSLA